MSDHRQHYPCADLRAQLRTAEAIARANLIALIVAYAMSTAALVASLTIWS